MEIGIHNVTVAIIVAVSVIGNEVMAVPAAVYGVVMFVPAGIVAYLLSRRAELTAQPRHRAGLTPGIAESDGDVRPDATADGLAAERIGSTRHVRNPILPVPSNNPCHPTRRTDR